MLNKFVRSFSFQLEFLPTEIAEQVSVTLCHYDERCFNIQLFDKFKILLSNTISNSVVKRQAEYFAGRLAARYALERLGHEDFDVGTGLHRSPLWPPGICASITHANGIAICLASFNKQFEYVGVDMEKVISPDVVRKISRSIIKADEFSFLELLELDYNVAFTIVFSAKETLFKALYPSVGNYFDFSAAKIERICTQSGKFTLSLTENLTQDLVAGSLFEGFFALHDQNVTTVLLI